LGKASNMDDRIRFGSKEENNVRREQAFLALTPSERLEWFLRSFGAVRNIRSGKKDSSGNFTISKRDAAVR